MCYNINNSHTECHLGTKITAVLSHPAFSPHSKRCLPMKTLLTIMRLPDGSQEHCGRAHTIWLALALTGMGCCVGGLSLFFSATAYVSLNSWHLLGAYLSSPLLMFLNLLPPVLLIWLFYFLFRRSWAAFICTFLPVLAVFRPFSLVARGKVW